MSGSEMLSGTPLGGTPSEEDNSIFRQKIASRLKKMDGFGGLVEEYGVSSVNQGGVIDILVKFRGLKIIYFVIECKDFRSTTINFPKLPVADIDKYDWGLYYNFTNRENSERHSIHSITKRPTYYSTDISCSKSNKTNKRGRAFDFDMFNKWAVQTSSNFMKFCIEEKTTRDKKTGEAEDIYVFPLLVCKSVMEKKEIIVISPHPYSFPHLAVNLSHYTEPLVRGELKKNAFLLINENNLEDSISKVIKELL